MLRAWGVLAYSSGRCSAVGASGHRESSRGRGRPARESAVTINDTGMTAPALLATVAQLEAAMMCPRPKRAGVEAEVRRISRNLYRPKYMALEGSRRGYGRPAPCVRGRAVAHERRVIR